MFESSDVNVETFASRTLRVETFAERVLDENTFKLYTLSFKVDTYVKLPV